MDGERLTVTVEEAANLLGVSRAFAYELVARRDLPSVRLGRRVLIPRRALERLLGLEPEPPSGSREHYSNLPSPATSSDAT